MATTEERLGEFWVRALERRGVIVSGNSTTPSPSLMAPHIHDYYISLLRRFGIPLTVPPTDIAWAGTHSVNEDAALGTVVGGALSGTDPGGLSLTFSIPDITSRFSVSGTSVRVTNVLDYETASSHNLTIRATNSGGGTFDKLFVVTVNDISETPAPNPPPANPAIITDNAANFDIPPYVVDASGAIKISGKNKALAAKFLIDFAAGTPPVTLQAGKTYVVHYTFDGSLMTLGGTLTMWGIVMKSGNNFMVVGPRGVGGGAVNIFRVSGTNWNASSGFTEVDDGAVLHGTLASNWLRLQVNSAGTQATISTSADGIVWDAEVTNFSLGPFSNVSQVTQFGFGAIFVSTDSGPWELGIQYWQSGVGAHRYWQAYITATNSGADNIARLMELQFHSGANGYGVDRAVGGTASADSEFGAPTTFLASNAFDGAYFEDANNQWASTNTAFPHSVTYDRGAGNDVQITGLSILACAQSQAAIDNAPKDFKLRWSDDNITYTDAFTVTGAIFGRFEFRHFPDPSAAAVTGSPHGRHRYWRFRFIEDDGGTIVSASKIELATSVGGAAIDTTGVTFTDSGHFSTWDFSLAFDGNSGTQYASSTSSDTTWAKVDFGSNSANWKALAEIRWTNRLDNSANQAPKTMFIEYGDDNTNWTIAWGVRNQTGWTLGQTRTFSDAAYVLGPPAIRESTIYVETLHQGGDAKIRESAIYAETLHQGGDQKVRESAIYVETLQQGGDTKLRESAIYVEVLMSEA